MSKEYPLVKDKKISETRRKQVEEDIQRGFEKNLLGRKLVRVENIKHDDLNRKFFKVGLSSITDKIWFVDEPGGTTYYSYDGLGYDYGEAVAEGETKGIIERIIENVKKENIIKTKGEKLTKEKFIELFEKLFHSVITDRFEGNIILTNIYDEFSFWYMDGFRPFKSGNDEDFSFKNPYGFIDLCGRELPIFASRLVPKGVTLLFDKNKLGTLLIKKPLQISIEDAGKLLEGVKEKIIKDLPSLKKEELYEKVRVMVYEIIRFEVENPEAVVMLKHEIKEE